MLISVFHHAERSVSIGCLLCAHVRCFDRFVPEMVQRNMKCASALTCTTNTTQAVPLPKTAAAQ